MRTRLLSLLAALTMLAAACGGSDEAVAELDTAQEAEAATAVPKPTATAVAPTATPVPEPTVTPVPEPTATPEPEPTAEPAAADEGEGSTTATEAESSEVVAVVDGAAIYIMSCASCHGANGEGARAKAITGVGAFFATDASPLVNLVTNGGTNMPSFGSRLSAEEIDAVVAHVVATFA